MDYLRISINYLEKAFDLTQAAYTQASKAQEALKRQERVFKSERDVKNFELCKDCQKQIENLKREISILSDSISDVEIFIEHQFTEKEW